MLDGRYDQHFLDVFAKSQDNPGPERHRRLATWLVLAYRSTLPFTGEAATVRSVISRRVACRKGLIRLFVDIIPLARRV
jgi:hypothetical protein